MLYFIRCPVSIVNRRGKRRQASGINEGVSSASVSELRLAGIQSNLVNKHTRTASWGQQQLQKETWDTCQEGYDRGGPPIAAMQKPCPYDSTGAILIRQGYVADNKVLQRGLQEPGTVGGLFVIAGQQPQPQQSLRFSAKKLGDGLCVLANRRVRVAPFYPTVVYFLVVSWPPETVFILE